VQVAIVATIFILSHRAAIAELGAVAEKKEVRHRSSSA